MENRSILSLVDKVKWVGTPKHRSSSTRNVRGDENFQGRPHAFYTTINKKATGTKPGGSKSMDDGSCVRFLLFSPVGLPAVLCGRRKV